MREHRDDGLRDIRKLPRASHGDKLVPFRKIRPAGHGELPHERPRPADLTEQLKKARRPAGIVQHIAIPLHAIGRNRRLPPRVPRRAAVVQPRIAQRTGPDVHVERHIQQEQALDRRTYGLLHGKQRPHGMRRDHDRLMPCAQFGKRLPGLLPPDRHGGRREIPRTTAMPLQKQIAEGPILRHERQEGGKLRGRPEDAVHEQHRAGCARQKALFRLAYHGGSSVQVHFRSDLFSIRSASSSNVTNR